MTTFTIESIREEVKKEREFVKTHRENFYGSDVHDIHNVKAREQICLKMEYLLANVDGADLSNKALRDRISAHMKEIQQIESTYEKKVGEYEVFFESLKAILNQTRPANLEMRSDGGHGFGS